MASSVSKNRKRSVSGPRSKMRRLKRLGWFAAAALVLLAGGVWLVEREGTRPGLAIDDMGRTHVQQQSVGLQYNSNPPTSGPHANAANWGEHFAEIPEVNQVHNLEHGGVLIQYNCDHEALQGRCQEVRQDLRSILNTAREEIDRKVILAPYFKMEHPIALTAWTRLQFLETQDAETILEFIRRNHNRAPEQVE